MTYGDFWHKLLSETLPNCLITWHTKCSCPFTLSTKPSVFQKIRKLDISSNDGTNLGRQNERFMTTSIHVLTSIFTINVIFAVVSDEKLILNLLCCSARFGDELALYAHHNIGVHFTLPTPKCTRIDSVTIFQATIAHRRLLWSN